MSEVYSFLEASVIRIGTTAGGTVETSMVYVEGVDVSVKSNLAERRDTQGVVQTRFPLSTDVEMKIKKLYGTDMFLLDGNAINIVLQNSVTGTETWQMAGCWYEKKGWKGAPQSGPMTYDISLVGKSWGTV